MDDVVETTAYEITVSSFGNAVATFISWPTLSEILKIRRFDQFVEVPSNELGFWCDEAERVCFGKLSFAKKEEASNG